MQLFYPVLETLGTPCNQSDTEQKYGTHLEHLHWHLGGKGQSDRGAHINGWGLWRCSLRVVGGLLSLLLAAFLLLKLLPHQLLAQQDA